ncbi:unnamed protein product [Sphagnum balticum]
MFESIVLTFVHFRKRTSCPDRDGTNRNGDLNGRRANTAAEGVNQNKFTCAQASLRNHGIICGDKCLRNGSSIGETQQIRDVIDRSMMDDNVFGIGAAADKTKNAIADLKTFDVWPELFDFAGKFKPRYIGGRAERRGYRPILCKISAWLRASALTRTRTSPRSGSGVFYFC